MNGYLAVWLAGCMDVWMSGLQIYTDPGAISGSKTGIAALAREKRERFAQNAERQLFDPVRDSGAEHCFSDGFG
jgi:hypothetical protein